MTTVTGKSAFSLVALLALAMLAPLGALVSAQDVHRTIAVSPATKQSGSPVQIVACHSTDQNLFDSVTVENLTDKVISSITFGTMYHPSPANSTLKPIFVKGEPLFNSIHPIEQKQIALATAPPKLILERTAAWNTDVVAELGVVEVVFEDGQKFNYDAQAEGGFDLKKTGVIVGSVAKLHSKP